MRFLPSRFVRRRCARRTTNEFSSRTEFTLYRSGTGGPSNARPRENPWGSEELRKKMGCKSSKISNLGNFDERWNNKTGLCLALRFEAGEEKSLGLKCGFEKKGYHTKRERKKETPIPEDVAKDSTLEERSEETDEAEDEPSGSYLRGRDSLPPSEVKKI